MIGMIQVDFIPDDQPPIMEFEMSRARDRTGKDYNDIFSKYVETRLDKIEGVYSFVDTYVYGVFCYRVQIKPDNVHRLSEINSNINELFMKGLHLSGYTKTNEYRNAYRH